MSELIKGLSRKEQEKIKPTPEDLIPLCLDGNMKKTALDFTAYLRKNKNKLVWFGCNAWKINYKGRPLCGLSAKKNVLSRRSSYLYSAAHNIFDNS